MGEMIHQAGLYGSDEEFLALAVPFVRDGLDGGEPVLVTTTTGNLALLGDALGDDARQVDYAETAYFGRRPAQRATAFLRYWRRHAARGRVRVLAEDALRTHPSISVGGRGERRSPAYADPLEFIGECDRAPLPEPPRDAAVLRVERLRDVRRFVGEQARRRDLPEDRVAMLCVAAHEAARYLGVPMTLRMWETFGSLVCDLRTGREVACGPLAGFTPPEADERPEDGLWAARQICEHVDIRQEDGGARVMLQAATSRLQERDDFS